MTYRFRCFSVGYLAILIYDQSRLAWKYRRKPQYWRFTNSSSENACHLQLCTHEESSARNQAQDILLESCTGHWLASDLAPDPLELCDTSTRVESRRYLYRSLLCSSFFFAEIRPIPRGWPQQRKQGMGMGLCGGTFRHERSRFLEKVFFFEIRLHANKYWLITTVTGQLWSLATTTLQVRLIIQLNSVLFAKTLVRKDVVSSAPPPPSPKDSEDGNADTETSEEDEDVFSSKAQVMNLMTTDVNRVSNFGWHIFALFGSWYFPLRLISISNVNARCTDGDRHRNSLFVWFTWYEDRIVVLGNIWMFLFQVSLASSVSP